ncbi:hypothetical protein UFOVP1_51 [uncultured Caudovirales phage]|uniref:Uncharacterized protein n=1 Tax=uncultured Caudovirales phage TaxID=2100421 RepID=A0A6J5KHT6_9CAUD|nr:hypothetical protein UFOVP1_51 [uncultured Caudovirales phage]
MSTSGSYSFTQTRNQLILDAFQLIGVYGIGRTIAPEDMTFACSMLNKMVKAWGSQGLHLWEKNEATLFLQPSVAVYTLGNASGDAYWGDMVSSNVEISSLTNNQNLGDSSITLNNASGMLVGDNIGIVQNGFLIQWTTITEIVGNVVSLTTPLTAAASAGNIVYDFTSRPYKPLRITSCRKLTGVDTGTTSNVTETWIKEMSYSEYFNMASKTINGTPSAYMYNPNDTDGKFYVWQRPSDPSLRLQFSYERIIQDLDNISDNFDFPTEWLEPLTYQLAIRIGPAYGKDQKIMQVILPLASQMLDALKDWDTEITGVHFQPDVGEWND